MRESIDRAGPFALTSRLSRKGSVPCHAMAHSRHAWEWRSSPDDLSQPE